MDRCHFCLSLLASTWPLNFWLDFFVSMFSCQLKLTLIPNLLISAVIWIFKDWFMLIIFCFVYLDLMVEQYSKFVTNFVTWFSWVDSHRINDHHNISVFEVLNKGKGGLHGSITKMVNYILVCTPSCRCACVGWPKRTDQQPHFVDTGCSLEGLVGAMNDRDGWWERVKEIRASSMTWWWFTNINCQALWLNLWHYVSVILLVQDED